jgi:hypothetical protein
MFNLFKKKKTLGELETEKDIILYTLDWFLMMNVINIDQYNEMLVKSIPLFRNFD